MQCLMCAQSFWSDVLCAAAGVVVYNFVAGGVHIAQTSPLHLHSLPVTFGLSAFVYSGHAVFPSIYRSMKDRSQYPRMLDTTYAIVGVTGALMGEPTACTAHHTALMQWPWPCLLPCCMVATCVAGHTSFVHLLCCQQVTHAIKSYMPVSHTCAQAECSLHSHAVLAGIPAGLLHSLHWSFRGFNSLAVITRCSGSHSSSDDGNLTGREVAVQVLLGTQCTVTRHWRK